MIDQETLGASIAYTKAHGGGGGGSDVTGVKGNAESAYRKGNVNITPANIGLGNVNNTSDANKPVSTAQQTALDGKVDKVVGKGLSTNDYTNADKSIVDGVTSALAGKVDKVTGKGLSTNDYDDIAKGIVDGVTSALAGKVSTSSVGSANGVAELDANGRVPSSQLPSYVDDVLEYADLAHFPATGETGKIYIAEDTNKTYRWSGSDYAEISESLALGETSSTAYAGNKGKANADAIAAIKDGTNIDSFGDVETALAGKANSSDLGDKSNLTTTDKSSAVAAINEVNGGLTDLKNDILFGDLPSNGFDPLTQCSGFFCYSVYPEKMLLQGYPNNYNAYGAIFGCSGTRYKLLVYIDVFGRIAVWSIQASQWIKYTSAN